MIEDNESEKVEEKKKVGTLWKTSLCDRTVERRIQAQTARFVSSRFLSYGTVRYGHKDNTV